jgi:hypothetical protein
MDISNFRDDRRAAGRRAPAYRIFERGHADIPLSDWEPFRVAPPRDLIDEVIDRSETELPECCVPLARGVAVVSRSLLQKAGHVCGSSRPRRWNPLRGDFLTRGWDGVAFVSESRRGGMLYTRRYGGLWNVEWATQGMFPQILVFRFGSTPLVARTCDEAMRLGELCLSAPPDGLCWVSVSGRDCSEHLIEFAKERAVNEALGRCTPSMVDRAA